MPPDMLHSFFYWEYDVFYMLAFNISNLLFLCVLRNYHSFIISKSRFCLDMYLLHKKVILFIFFCFSESSISATNPSDLLIGQTSFFQNDPSDHLPATISGNSHSENVLVEEYNIEDDIVLVLIKENKRLKQILNAKR